MPCMQLPTSSAYRKEWFHMTGSWIIHCLVLPHTDAFFMWRVAFRHDAISIILHSVTCSKSYNKTSTKSCYKQAGLSTFKKQRGENRNYILTHRDKTHENALYGAGLRHVLSAVGFPARAWYVITVPIHSVLRSGQLAPQLHMIWAKILRYQTERTKDN